MTSHGKYDDFEEEKKLLPENEEVDMNLIYQAALGNGEEAKN